MHQINKPEEPGGVLARLRSLAPLRRLTLAEALQVAELQAARLLSLQGIDDVPVPDEVITSLPRIRVEYDRNLPTSVSGCSDWDRHRRVWVIALNPREPHTRRRLTMLHEYKHIIDHNGPPLLRPQLVPGVNMAPEEYLADYFAGCVLIARSSLKAAYANRGLQTPAALARHFDVSVRAIEVRLSQIGLLTPSDDPGPVDSAGSRFASARWPHQYPSRTPWSCPLRRTEAAL
jgi:Zn-dependent peptidase ImmA (M78 family)